MRRIFNVDENPSVNVEPDYFNQGQPQKPTSKKTSNKKASTKKETPSVDVQVVDVNPEDLVVDKQGNATVTSATAKKKPGRKPGSTNKSKSKKKTGSTKKTSR